MSVTATQNDFEFYLKFAKPLVLNLSKPDDRALAAAWIQKLRDESVGDLRLRTDYLKLLLFVLQRKKLIGTFAVHPSGVQKLDEFPESNLLDVAKELLQSENEYLREKILKGLATGAGDFPPFSTEHSADLLEYSAAQDIPNFGVHAYYAISNEPLPNWERTEKAVFPKGAASATERGAPSKMSTATSEPALKPSHSKSRPRSKSRSRSRSPRGGPSPTLGSKPKDDDDRSPPTWGSNLIGVTEPPVRDSMAEPQNDIPEAGDPYGLSKAPCSPCGSPERSQNIERYDAGTPQYSPQLPEGEANLPDGTYSPEGVYSFTEPTVLPISTRTNAFALKSPVAKSTPINFPRNRLSPIVERPYSPEFPAGEADPFFLESPPNRLMAASPPPWSPQVRSPRGDEQYNFYSPRLAAHMYSPKLPEGEADPFFLETPPRRLMAESPPPWSPQVQSPRADEQYNFYSPRLAAHMYSPKLPEGEADPFFLETPPRRLMAESPPPWSPQAQSPRDDRQYNFYSPRAARMHSPELPQDEADPFFLESPPSFFRAESPPPLPSSSRAYSPTREHGASGTRRNIDEDLDAFDNMIAEFDDGVCPLPPTAQKSVKKPSTSVKKPVKKIEKKVGPARRGMPAATKSKPSRTELSKLQQQKICDPRSATASARSVKSVASETKGPRPGTSRIGGPGTSRVSVPGRVRAVASSSSQLSAPGGPRPIPRPGSARIPVPGTGRMPVPGSARIPVPGSARIPVPGTGRIPVPGSARIAVPGTGRIPVPGSVRIPVPGTGRIPVPGSARIPVPGTGRIPVPGSVRIPVSATGRIPVSGSSRLPAPSGSRIPPPSSSQASMQSGTRIPLPGDSRLPRAGGSRIPGLGSSVRRATSGIPQSQTQQSRIAQRGVSKIPGVGPARSKIAASPPYSPEFPQGEADPFFLESPPSFMDEASLDSSGSYEYPSFYGVTPPPRRPPYTDSLPSPYRGTPPLRRSPISNQDYDMDLLQELGINADDLITDVFDVADFDEINISDVALGPGIEYEEPPEFNVQDTTINDALDAWDRQIAELEAEHAEDIALYGSPSFKEARRSPPAEMPADGPPVISQGSPAARAIIDAANKQLQRSMASPERPAEDSFEEYERMYASQSPDKPKGKGAFRIPPGSRPLDLINVVGKARAQYDQLGSPPPPSFKEGRRSPPAEMPADVPPVISQGSPAARAIIDAANKQLQRSMTSPERPAEDSFEEYERMYASQSPDKPKGKGAFRIPPGSRPQDLINVVGKARAQYDQLGSPLPQPEEYASSEPVAQQIVEEMSPRQLRRDAALRMEYEEYKKQLKHRRPDVPRTPPIFSRFRSLMEEEAGQGYEYPDFGETSDVEWEAGEQFFQGKTSQSPREDLRGSGLKKLFRGMEVEAKDALFFDQESIPELEDFEDEYENSLITERSPAATKTDLKKRARDATSELVNSEESSPAAAGLPITTPRRSPSPKRRTTTISILEDDEAMSFDIPPYESPTINLLDESPPIGLESPRSPHETSLRSPGSPVESPSALRMRLLHGNILKYERPESMIVFSGKSRVVKRRSARPKLGSVRESPKKAHEEAADTTGFRRVREALEEKFAKLPQLKHEDLIGVQGYVPRNLEREFDSAIQEDLPSQQTIPGWSSPPRLKKQPKERPLPQEQATRIYQEMPPTELMYSPPQLTPESMPQLYSPSRSRSPRSPVTSPTVFSVVPGDNLEDDLLPEDLYYSTEPAITSRPSPRASPVGSPHSRLFGAIPYGNLIEEAQPEGLYYSPEPASRPSSRESPVGSPHSRLFGAIPYDNLMGEVQPDGLYYSPEFQDIPQSDSPISSPESPFSLRLRLWQGEEPPYYSQEQTWVVPGSRGSKKIKRHSDRPAGYDIRELPDDYDEENIPFQSQLDAAQVHWPKPRQRIKKPRLRMQIPARRVSPIRESPMRVPYFTEVDDRTGFRRTREEMERQYADLPEITHVLPEDLLGVESYAPVSPGHYGELDRSIDENLPSPIRPVSSVYGWTTPPQLKIQKVKRPILTYRPIVAPEWSRAFQNPEVTDMLSQEVAPTDMIYSPPPLSPRTPRQYRSPELQGPSPRQADPDLYQSPPLPDIFNEPGIPILDEAQPEDVYHSPELASRPSPRASPVGLPYSRLFGAIPHVDLIEEGQPEGLYYSPEPASRPSPRESPVGSPHSRLFGAIPQDNLIEEAQPEGLYYSPEFQHIPRPRLPDSPISSPESPFNLRIRLWQGEEPPYYSQEQTWVVPGSRGSKKIKRHSDRPAGYDIRELPDDYDEENMPFQSQLDAAQVHWPKPRQRLKKPRRRMKIPVRSVSPIRESPIRVPNITAADDRTGFRQAREELERRFAYLPELPDDQLDAGGYPHVQGSSPIRSPTGVPGWSTPPHLKPQRAERPFVAPLVGDVLSQEIPPGHMLYSPPPLSPRSSPEIRPQTPELRQPSPGIGQRSRSPRTPTSDMFPSVVASDGNLLDEADLENLYYSSTSPIQYNIPSPRDRNPMLELFEVMPSADLIEEAQPEGLYYSTEATSGPSPRASPVGSPHSRLFGAIPHGDLIEEAQPEGLYYSPEPASRPSPRESPVGSPHSRLFGAIPQDNLMEEAQPEGLYYSPEFQDIPRPRFPDSPISSPESPFSLRLRLWQGEEPPYYSQEQTWVVPGSRGSKKIKRHSDRPAGYDIRELPDDYDEENMPFQSQLDAAQVHWPKPRRRIKMPRLKMKVPARKVSPIRESPMRVPNITAADDRTGFRQTRQELEQRFADLPELPQQDLPEHLMDEQSRVQWHRPTSALDSPPPEDLPSPVKPPTVVPGWSTPPRLRKPAKPAKPYEMKFMTGLRDVLFQEEPPPELAYSPPPSSPSSPHDSRDDRQSTPPRRSPPRVPRETRDIFEQSPQYIERETFPAGFVLPGSSPVAADSPRISGRAGEVFNQSPDFLLMEMPPAEFMPAYSPPTPPHWGRVVTPVSPSTPVEERRFIRQIAPSASSHLPIKRMQAVRAASRRAMEELSQLEEGTPHRQAAEEPLEAQQRTSPHRDRVEQIISDIGDPHMPRRRPLVSPKYGQASPEWSPKLPNVDLFADQLEEEFVPEGVWGYSSPKTPKISPVRSVGSPAERASSPLQPERSHSSPMRPLSSPPPNIFDVEPADADFLDQILPPAHFRSPTSPPTPPPLSDYYQVHTPPSPGSPDQLADSLRQHKYTQHYYDPGRQLMTKRLVIKNKVVPVTRSKRPKFSPVIERAMEDSPKRSAPVVYEDEYIKLSPRVVKTETTVTREIPEPPRPRFADPWSDFQSPPKHKKVNIPAKYSYNEISEQQATVPESYRSLLRQNLFGARPGQSGLLETSPPGDYGSPQSSRSSHGSPGSPRYGHDISAEQYDVSYQSPRSPGSKGSTPIQQRSPQRGSPNYALPRADYYGSPGRLYIRTPNRVVKETVTVIEDEPYDDVVASERMPFAEIRSPEMMDTSLIPDDLDTSFVGDDMTGFRWIR